MLYDEPCTQGRLQVLEDGTLRVVQAPPFNKIVWQTSRALVTGLTTQKGALGSYNVTVHTNAGNFQARMVTQKNFAKLQALIASMPVGQPPLQPVQQQGQPFYAPYGGLPAPPQQPIQQQPGPYAPYGQPLTVPPPMQQGQPFTTPPPMSPTPSPAKKGHKRTWIVLGIIAALLVLVGLIGNTGNKSQPQPGNSSSSIATPDPLAGARFGGQFVAFTAKYGQPNSVISNLAFIQNLQVSNDQGQVDDMLVGVPKGQTWTMSGGESQCKAFYPADAIHVRDFLTADVDKLNDGVAMIYTSAALAGVFPASRFTDQQHHPVAAGTFTVAYSYTFSKSTNQWDKTHMLQCELDLGIPDYLKTYAAVPTPVSSGQHIVATHGTPHLDGPLSDFYGKYGQPFHASDTGVLWNLNSDGSLSIVVRGGSNGAVNYLSLLTPDSWSLEKIKGYCLQYAPDGYTLNPTSPADGGGVGLYVFDSSSGRFAIHLGTGSCWMNPIDAS